MAAISDDAVSRKTTVIGPFRLEFVWQAAADTGSFSTTMPRPIAACAGQYSNHIDSGIYTSISGKTVTVTLPGLPEDVAVLVFGF